MTILFYPDIPYKGNKIGEWMNDLNISYHNHPDREYDLAFWWSVQTKHEFTEPHFRAWNRIDFINKKVLDVRKSVVDAYHRRIFGYGLKVDPFKVRGTIIAKSETQYDKSGKIIKAPIQDKEQGVFYQKLLDCRIDKDIIEEFRVCIFNSWAEIIIHKTIKCSDMFTNNVISSRIIDNPFSVHEIADIYSFCLSFGLEYGELDVLRDSDGKIYIVDVNNCPGSGFLRTCTKDEYELLKSEFANFISL